MMTYTQIQTKQPNACTCASCPKFHDYGDPNGKGWCNLFNRPAAQHHALTADCLLNLPSQTTNDTLPSEDRNYCKYQQGDLVKLIDSHKHHSDWESFIVIGQKYNANRFRSDESYLNEPTWYILIATVDRPIPDQYWKPETDICHEAHSEFIDTEEVF